MERISNSSLFKHSNLTEHDAVSIGKSFTAVPNEHTAPVFSAQAVHEDLSVC